MTIKDLKRVLKATLAELESSRRIISRLEIENDELKQKIKKITEGNK